MRDTGMKSELGRLSLRRRTLTVLWQVPVRRVSEQCFQKPARRLMFLKHDASNEEDVKAKSPASGGTRGIESRFHTR